MSLNDDFTVIMFITLLLLRLMCEKTRFLRDSAAESEQTRGVREQVVDNG